MNKKQIGTCGLLINALGTLIIAVSVAEFSGGYTTSINSGINYHLAIVSNLGFKLGLFLMTLGFIFQIYERLINETQKEPTHETIVLIFLVTLLIYVSILYLIQMLLFY